MLQNMDLLILILGNRIRFLGGQYAMFNGKPYDLDCYNMKANEILFAPPPPDWTIRPPPTAVSNLNSTVVELQRSLDTYYRVSFLRQHLIHPLP